MIAKSSQKGEERRHFGIVEAIVGGSALIVDGLERNPDVDRNEAEERVDAAAFHVDGVGVGLRERFVSHSRQF